MVERFRPGMGRLVDAKLAASGESNIRNLAPALVLYLARANFVPGHFLDKNLDILTDEKKFLLIILIGWVHRQFGRR